LIPIDLLKVKAILEHHITDLSKCSLERVIRDIRHLPLIIFLSLIASSLGPGILSELRPFGSAFIWVAEISDLVAADYEE
jgi:hypothetical protein